MPYSEDYPVVQWDPKSEGQPKLIQPYHKEETTAAHESANENVEKGISNSSTEDCSSVNTAGMTPTDIAGDKSDSVSDIGSVYGNSKGSR